MKLSKIRPEDIPDVPTQKFLMRDEQRQVFTQHQQKLVETPEETQKKKEAKYRGYTKSGRKIKGRGFLVSLFTLMTIYKLC